MPLPPPFWLIGALSGASSIAMGAFGAHGLQARGIAPAKIASFQTAAHYQLIHSLAIIVAEQAAPKNVWAKSLFTAGIVMFSGSIYGLVLDGQRFGKVLGPVTPLGGVCFIGGWLALAFGSRGRIAL
ncbi:hypothetical protein HII31_00215 [Pseudocercospora fuligena]|uniref:DUF423-domain-containing protein n=1 Tax=Pseudocercospora fuligena TaxID=685502 RepID=A0A8H6RWL5_9PEZI|nr:hypothetical protein HII31_00215 [Pseudocercospora fuligena]